MSSPKQQKDIKKNKYGRDLSEFTKKSITGLFFHQTSIYSIVLRTGRNDEEKHNIKLHAKLIQHKQAFVFSVHSFEKQMNENELVTSRNSLTFNTIFSDHLASKETKPKKKKATRKTFGNMKR